MSKPVNIAILGATGAVGTELLKLLESRNFPLNSLKLLASPRSAGSKLTFKGETLEVKEVKANSFSNIDLVLASAGSSVSKVWAKTITNAGAVMIDNSSAFRLDPDVPLIIPEINPKSLIGHNKIIANPNCTTILMAMVIYPLHKIKPIKRIVVSTYQSVSGAGTQAIEEMKQQFKNIFNDKKPEAKILPYPLAFNLFLHDSKMTDTGYCEEEMKMVNETRKIFNEPDLKVTATCVRVPVLRAHSESINLEFDEPFPVNKAREAILQTSGIQLCENWQKNHFPMPVDASNNDDVLVGRIRQDISHPCGLELWICGDQILKGAALNAVQIAELLINKNY